MTLTTCPKCAGSGLIGGNPDAPHLHVGALKTCPDCTGTGKIEVADEAASTTPENATVDNPPASEKPRGIFSRILG